MELPFKDGKIKERERKGDQEERKEERDDRIKCKVRSTMSSLIREIQVQSSSETGIEEEDVQNTAPGTKGENMERKPAKNNPRSGRIKNPRGTKRRMYGTPRSRFIS